MTTAPNDHAVRTEYRSASEAQTEAVGSLCAEIVRPGDIVALVGGLGAGKTRFVRGLAQGLGHDPADVSSPTFVLVLEHDTPGRLPLLHADAYRLDVGCTGRGVDIDALAEVLGFDEGLAAGGVLAIEWPDRVAGLLDHPSARRLTVELTPTAQSARRIVITSPADRPPPRPLAEPTIPNRDSP
jgi:tRNA threonylcarbamoyladenosine biosynthesis protein TsaE